MAIPRISKQTEEKILRGVDRMSDFIDGGLDPDEALYKVASEGSYQPGHVRLIAQAYNTGKTIATRKAGSDSLEKTATFPLADAATVLRRIFPEEVKSAAIIERGNALSDAYRMPPYWVDRQAAREKVAGELPPYDGQRRQLAPRDPDRLVKKAFDLISDLERELASYRWRLVGQQEKVSAALERLDHWFRQTGNEARFPLVYRYAGQLWGSPATRVLDKVASANPRLRLGNGATRWDGPIERQREPWSHVAGCLDALRAQDEFEKEAQTFYKVAVDKAVELMSRVLPSLAPVTEIRGSIMTSEKRALLDVLTKIVPGVAITDAMRGVLDEAKPTSKDKLKSDAYMEVTDPGHEANLRKIRTRSILTDMLANDDFLSAEQPTKVTDLYNKISHLSPRAAEQPILMQALLRRYLAQGQVDPHDLDQLVGIEHKLKAIDEPSRGVNLPRLPGSSLMDNKKPRSEEE